MMNLDEKKVEPMATKRIAGTCEHVVVYEAKNVAIYPEGVLVAGILGRLQLIINHYDEPMFIFDPDANTPAPFATTSYDNFFSSVGAFKTYWKGRKDPAQEEPDSSKIAGDGKMERRSLDGAESEGVATKVSQNEKTELDFSEFKVIKRLKPRQIGTGLQLQSHSPSSTPSPTPVLSPVSRSKSPFLPREKKKKRLSAMSYYISLRVSEIFSVHEQRGEPICGSKLVMAQCEAGTLPEFYFLEGDISDFFRKLSIFTVLRPSEHNSNFYFSYKATPSVSPTISSEEKKLKDEDAGGERKGGEGREGEDKEERKEGEEEIEVDGVFLYPLEEGDKEREQGENDFDSEFMPKVDGGFSSMMRCMSNNVVESHRERSERDSQRNSQRDSPWRNDTPPPSPLVPTDSPCTPNKSRAHPSGSPPLSPLPATLSSDFSDSNQEEPSLSSSPTPHQSGYTSYFFPSLSSKSPSSTISQSEVLKADDLMMDSFHMVDTPKPKEFPLHRIRVRRLDELSAEDWDSFFDEEGKLRTCHRHVLSRIFSGGVVHEIRAVVWKFLLGFYPWDSTQKERDQIQREKTKEYEMYKGQWTSITRRQLQRFRKFREILSRVKKDVVRTDRTKPFFAGNQNPNLMVLNDVLVTYCMYNFDLGYCQGMNDLLSPIVFVMDAQESDCFWCFKGYMDMAQRNFEKSQKFIQEQLLELHCLLSYVDPVLSKHLVSLGADNMIFCFRWLLCRFKREFEFFDTMRLWEVTWTNITPNFHLFVALAMLLNIRNPILSQCSRFDEILKICNDVAGTQDVEEILVMAEFIFEYWSIQVGNPRLHTG